MSKVLNPHVDRALELFPIAMRLLKATACHALPDHNVPVTHIFAIQYLHRSPGQTLGELARGLGISPATASELIDRLVDTGHVERTVDPDDRRRVSLSLTDEAEGIAHRLREYRAGQLQRAMDPLSEMERDAFIRGLDRLVAVLAEDAGIGASPVADEYRGRDIER